jgi:hypothetical protein
MMARKSRYKWKPQAQVPVDANVAGREIERVRAEKQGFYQPHDLVVAARPSEAPLHPGFEWDDTTAAEAFRVEQAKYIVRNIVLIEGGHRSPDLDGKRAYVSVRIETDEGERNPRYTAIQVALEDPRLRDQMILAAIRDLHAFEAKYSVLSEFAGLIEDMIPLREKLEAEIGVAFTDN